MRLLAAAVLVAAACGGAQIPEHSGYKSEKSKPWKSAKPLKLDDKLQAKVEGDLNYATFHRARWYSFDLASTSQVDIKLEITPPGDAVNDEFDLAIEVLDPGNRVVFKSDLEEEDAKEQSKQRTLLDLQPGHYLVHLYLQDRRDSCEYVLRLAIKPTAPAERKSDFPAQVAFLPALPMVPINDDTPKNYRPPTQTVVKTTKRTTKVKQEAPPPPPSPTISARIIDLRVVSGGTVITVSRGTNSGASAGMKVKINGISGTFQLASCNERSCTATVPATPDQVRSAGNVVLTP